MSYERDLFKQAKKPYGVEISIKSDKQAGKQICIGDFIRGARMLIGSIAR